MYPTWGSALNYPHLAQRYCPELLKFKSDDAKDDGLWWDVDDKATRIMVLELLILEIQNS